MATEDWLERTVDRVPRLLRIVLAIGFAAFSLIHHSSATMARDPGPGRGDVALADVRDAGIFPARAWIDGVNPWDPDAFTAYDERIGQTFPVYSPVHIALHLPFAAGPLEGSREAYYWMSMGLAGLLAAMLLRVGHRRITLESSAVVFGALLWTHPGSLSLVAGQSGVPLAIAGVLTLTASTPIAVVLGIVLALSKPTFGVPLVVMALARGRSRSVVIGAAIAGAISLAMLLRLTAANGLRSVVSSFTDNLDVTAPIGSPKRVDLASAAARLLDARPGVLFEITVATVVLVLAFVAIRRLHRHDAGDDAALALAFCIPSVVFFHGSWDLVTAIPALAVLTRPCARGIALRPLGGFGGWVRAAVVALFVYVVVNPWGRRWSEGLYDDRLTALLAARLRTGFFLIAVGLLIASAWCPSPHVPSPHGGEGGERRRRTRQLSTPGRHRRRTQGD